MTFFAVRFHVYHPLMPRLEFLLQRLHVSQIVDLCSGGAGPARVLVRQIHPAGGEILRVILTDKYPNRAAFELTKNETGGKIDYVATPVDATAVPGQLSGFRTLFASFHHFRPDQARAILQDAAQSGQGIAVFEYTERNVWIWTLPLLLIPVFMWLCMPLVRPLTWRHLLWTYLVPAVPAMAVWDGLVSCLRTYSPRELDELTGACVSSGYRWESGRMRTFGACRITYLFGYPSEAVREES